MTRLRRETMACTWDQKIGGAAEREGCWENAVFQDARANPQAAARKF